jgi:hypothetical protein
MPNHVRIAMSVTGDPQQVARFVETAKGKPYEDGSPNYLEFDNIVPMPQGLKDRSYGAEAEAKAADEAGIALEAFDGCISAYGWQYENWGTKWGPYSQGEPVVVDGCVTYAFTSAWGPPIVWIQKASEAYPDLLFIVSFGGEGPCLGRFTYLAGLEIHTLNGDIIAAPEQSEELEDLEDRYSDLTDEEKETYEALESDHWEEYLTWQEQYIETHTEYLREQSDTHLVG